MRYDVKKGYGLYFTKFDSLYHDSIIYRESKEKIIQLADCILVSLGKKSLLEELNDMQAIVWTYDSDNPIFENKFKIPAYFINLILAKYNMKVLGWE